jgi:hypothetical protein
VAFRGWPVAQRGTFLPGSEAPGKMSKLSDSRVALYALIFFAFWLFVVLPFLYAPDHNPEPCEHVEKLGFWQKTRCDPVAYFTLWLMAFTGVLGIATIGLLFATNRTAQISERALSEHERPWVFFRVLQSGFGPDRLVDCLHRTTSM